jgi:DNA-binding MarR family transcriptional regulator
MAPPIQEETPTPKAIRRIAMTKPKQIHILRAIAWLDERDGNALYTELLKLFTQVLDYDEDSLRRALDALEARKYIQTDGRTHRGRHYSITWAGNEKIHKIYAALHRAEAA